MRTITYKYNVGDVVELKPKHRISIKVNDNTTMLLSEVIIEERRDYNGPCYRFVGDNTFYKEACIKSLASRSFLNDVCAYENEGLTTTLPEDQNAAASELKALWQA